MKFSLQHVSEEALHDALHADLVEHVWCYHSYELGSDIEEGST